MCGCQSNGNGEREAESQCRDPKTKGYPTPRDYPWELCSAGTSVTEGLVSVMEGPESVTEGPESVMEGQHL